MLEYASLVPFVEAYLARALRYVRQRKFARFERQVNFFISAFQLVRCLAARPETVEIILAQHSAAAIPGSGSGSGSGAARAPSAAAAGAVAAGKDTEKEKADKKNMRSGGSWLGGVFRGGKSSPQRAWSTIAEAALELRDLLEGGMDEAQLVVSTKLIAMVRPEPLACLHGRIAVHAHAAPWRNACMCMHLFLHSHAASQDSRSASA